MAGGIILWQGDPGLFKNAQEVWTCKWVSQEPRKQGRNVSPQFLFHISASVPALTSLSNRLRSVSQTHPFFKVFLSQQQNEVEDLGTPFSSACPASLESPIHSMCRDLIKVRIKTWRLILCLEWSRCMQFWSTISRTWWDLVDWVFPTNWALSEGSVYFKGVSQGYLLFPTSSEQCITREIALPTEKVFWDVTVLDLWQVHWVDLERHWLVFQTNEAGSTQTPKVQFFLEIISIYNSYRCNIVMNLCSLKISSTSQILDFAEPFS